MALEIILICAAMVAILMGAAYISDKFNIGRKTIVDVFPPMPTYNEYAMFGDNYEEFGSFVYAMIRSLHDIMGVECPNSKRDIYPELTRSRVRRINGRIYFVFEVTRKNPRALMAAGKISRSVDVYKHQTEQLLAGELNGYLRDGYYFGGQIQVLVEDEKLIIKIFDVGYCPPYFGGDVMI